MSTRGSLEPVSNTFSTMIACSPPPPHRARPWPLAPHRGHNIPSAGCRERKCAFFSRCLADTFFILHIQQRLQVVAELINNTQVFHIPIILSHRIQLYVAITSTFINLYERACISNLRGESLYTSTCSFALLVHRFPFSC